LRKAAPKAHPPRADELAVLDEDLVPELGRARAQLGEHILLEEWVAHAGDVQIAIGYLRVFWPHFLEHNGGVFLQAGFSEQSWQEWQVVLTAQADIREYERNMNHLALIDLFQNPHFREQITYTQLQFVAQQLQAMWQQKLAADFPGRQFVVELMLGDEPEDIGISFCQAG
jgi:hypothetical protein